MKYRVTATRSTIYEGEADDCEHAIDEMIEGEFDEVDTNTENISAEPICPEHDEELTDETTRVIEVDGETRTEPTWCRKCGRDLAV